MIVRRARRWLPALLLIAAGCGSADVERIVVVTFDTTRASRLGCYGHELAETPNLDAFAAESVLFERAVSPVPTTLPSHSTMFTGVYPQDHGVRYNLLFRLGPEALTVAEILGAEGFATGGFPATFILDERFGLNQGFDTYANAPRPDDGGTSHRTAIMRSASDGVDLALDWLSSRQGKVFAWLHFYDPHWPYTPPFPYSSRFRDRPYDGELAYTDSQFGRFIKALREDPSWDRTAVIVAGDHGEGLYEHDERFHATLVYETTQHVPLIVRTPDSRAGRIAEPVGIVDLTPTILDLAGVDPPEDLRGVSLVPALRGTEPERRDLYFESHAGSLSYGWERLSGLRYGRWKLIDSSTPNCSTSKRIPTSYAIWRRSSRIDCRIFAPRWNPWRSRSPRRRRRFRRRTRCRIARRERSSPAWVTWEAFPAGARRARRTRATSSTWKGSCSPRRCRSSSRSGSDWWICRSTCSNAIRRTSGCSRVWRSP